MKIFIVSGYYSPVNYNFRNSLIEGFVVYFKLLENKRVLVDEITLVSADYIKFQVKGKKTSEGYAEWLENKIDRFDVDLCVVNYRLDSDDEKNNLFFGAFKKLNKKFQIHHTYLESMYNIDDLRGPIKNRLGLFKKYSLTPDVILYSGDDDHVYEKIVEMGGFKKVMRVPIMNDSQESRQFIISFFQDLKNDVQIDVPIRKISFSMGDESIFGEGIKIGTDVQSYVDSMRRFLLFSAIREVMYSLGMNVEFKDIDNPKCDGYIIMRKETYRNAHFLHWLLKRNKTENIPTLGLGDGFEIIFRSLFSPNGEGGKFYVLDKSDKSCKLEVLGCDGVKSIERFESRRFIQNCSTFQQFMKIEETSPDSKSIFRVSLPKHPFFRGVEYRAEDDSRHGKPKKIFIDFVDAVLKCKFKREINFNK